MKKKRILILGSDMEIGGAERALLGLMDAIDTEQYEVDLFLLRHQGPFLQLIPNKINLLPENSKYSDLGVPIVNVIKKGHIMMAFPFENLIKVIELTGKDLAETLGIIVLGGHANVSNGTEIIFNPTTKEITDILIEGQPLDINKTYRVATIDYLADGGDYLTPLTKGKTIATSKNSLTEDLIKYLSSHTEKLNPPTTIRIHPK